MQHSHKLSHQMNLCLLPLKKASLSGICQISFIAFELIVDDGGVFGKNRAKKYTFSMVDLRENFFQLDKKYMSPIDEAPEKNFFKDEYPPEKSFELNRHDFYVAVMRLMEIGCTKIIATYYPNVSGAALQLSGYAEKGYFLKIYLYTGSRSPQSTVHCPEVASNVYLALGLRHSLEAGCFAESVTVSIEKNEPLLLDYRSCIMHNVRLRTLHCHLN
jgi:hypothetical protein